MCMAKNKVMKAVHMKIGLDFQNLSAQSTAARLTGYRYLVKTTQNSESAMENSHISLKYIDFFFFLLRTSLSTLAAQWDTTFREIKTKVGRGTLLNTNLIPECETKRMRDKGVIGYCSCIYQPVLGKWTDGFLLFFFFNERPRLYS